MDECAYTRDELISICEDGVVKWQDWGDRDSYMAQVQLSDIYSLLRVGAEYDCQVENDRTIWIDFHNVTNEMIDDAKNYRLDYDDREKYLEEHDYDYEMFDGKGLDIKYDRTEYSGYMPTRTRLKETQGGDWY